MRLLGELKLVQENPLAPSSPTKTLMSVLEMLLLLQTAKFGILKARVSMKGNVFIGTAYMSGILA